MQRILTFFSTKNNSVFVILPFEIYNYINESLTNTIVNFEQLAPDCVSKKGKSGNWGLSLCRSGTGDPSFG